MCVCWLVEDECENMGTRQERVGGERKERKMIKEWIKGRTKGQTDESAVRGEDRILVQLSMLLKHSIMGTRQMQHVIVKLVRNQVLSLTIHVPGRQVSVLGVLFVMHEHKEVMYV